MDVVVENCSYIFDTSAIHGGRMQVLHGAKTCRGFLGKSDFRLYAPANSAEEL